MISENSKLFCIVSVSVLRIRDVYPDPGSREDSLKIEVVLTLKTVSKLLGKIKRSGMFTLDLNPDFFSYRGSRIPDPGIKKHRIPDPDPQHCQSKFPCQR
jgi:hypothetical protein